MLTYQDLLKVGESDSERMEFVRNVINRHKSTPVYRDYLFANDYYNHRNTTIVNYQKLLYTVTGKAIPDNYSANFKMASKFFYRFVTQQNQYLLGNGVTWSDPNTADKLGTKKYKFNTQLKKLGKEALKGGTAFGFWDVDHVVVFNIGNFAPLYDEEDGALKAGVRFWQVAPDKPLRATLYELDGYTEYIWNKKEISDGSTKEVSEVMAPKRAYKLNVAVSTADGEEILDGENYPTFPIVPLFANDNHQSELVGLREQIDCFDLIKSGFANTVDEASLIYWTIQNAGGMDDVDLAQYVERIRSLHASVTDDGITAEPNAIEPPYQSREALLDRLRADLYEDAMALDTKALASGGSVVTAVIKSAYEPLDDKCDDYESFVTEFIDRILEFAGVDDVPTFTRSKIINVTEDVQTLVMSAQYLPQDYVTTKILTLYGDADKTQDILEQMDVEDMTRFGGDEGDEEE